MIIEFLHLKDILSANIIDVLAIFKALFYICVYFDKEIQLDMIIIKFQLIFHQTMI